MDELKSSYNPLAPPPSPPPPHTTGADKISILENWIGNVKNIVGLKLNLKILSWRGYKVKETKLISLAR